MPPAMAWIATAMGAPMRPSWVTPSSAVRASVGRAGLNDVVGVEYETFVVRANPEAPTINVMVRTRTVMAQRMRPSLEVSFSVA